MSNTPIAAPTASPSTDRLALGTEVVRAGAPGSNPAGVCACTCTCACCGSVCCVCFENE